MGRADQQGQRERLLFYRVMQIARHSLAFFQRGQLLPRSQQMLHLQCHVIEILSKLAQFIRRAVGYMDLEVTCAPGMSRRCDPLQTPSDASGREHANKSTDHTHDENEQECVG